MSINLSVIDIHLPHRFFDDILLRQRTPSGYVKEREIYKWLNRIPRRSDESYSVDVLRYVVQPFFHLLQ